MPYLRGYHPATFSDRKFRISDLADDFALLLDGLGEQTGTVVGHDWGTSVAYGAGTKYPDRVTKLVAIGIPHPLTIKPKLTEVAAGRHFLYFKLPWARLTAGAFDLKLVDRCTDAGRPAGTALRANSRSLSRSKRCGTSASCVARWPTTRP